MKKSLDEFECEEPTKPEVTESLATTLDRLRTEIATSERPTVRMRALDPESK